MERISSNNIKPADENARRILIEDMRDTQKKAGKRKKKQEEGFGNFRKQKFFSLAEIFYRKKPDYVIQSISFLCISLELMVQR